ncbi:MAG: hypothetical protein HEEMFOPI_01048 [Holosporales bacterium]
MNKKKILLSLLALFLSIVALDFKTNKFLKNNFKFVKCQTMNYF